MDKKFETKTGAEAKKRAEAKTAILLAVIFGGMIVAMIAGMLVFDIYAEKLEGGVAPTEAADR